jgi:NAD(P)-dependent dehydrogenase (short-subunit alcohol dehydrogenase family)
MRLPKKPVALTFLLSFVVVDAMILEGKRILVTGAGRGIGRSIALICHGENAKVAIVSRTKSELEETIKLATKELKVDECSSSMTAYVVDVTNQQQVDTMVQDIVDLWGGIDVLVNNAGGSQNPKGAVHTLNDPVKFTSLLQLNVVGPHIVTNAVTRLAMKENGRILNVSSKAGKVGLQNYSFYVASKFALEGMTSSWAKELKERQIVVNSLSPGMVNTKSFPKPPDKKGVRTPESIRDCLLFALTSSMEFTGHYVHADEYDMVIQQKGEAAANEAWKCIDETQFQVT